MLWASPAGGGTTARAAGEGAIFVTDNGSSFIAKRFWTYLQGRYRTCGFSTARRRSWVAGTVHKTLKLEEVYWRLYDNPGHARECLEEFRQRYNERRPHWALVPETGGDPLVPVEVYTGSNGDSDSKWQGWAKGAKAKLDQMLAADAA